MRKNTDSKTADFAVRLRVIRFSRPLHPGFALVQETDGARNEEKPDALYFWTRG
jgi:hypothetical protein